VDQVLVARVERLVAPPGQAEAPLAVQPVVLREALVVQEPGEVAVRAAPEEQVAPNNNQPARRFLFWRRRSTCANVRLATAIRQVDSGDTGWNRCRWNCF
jgi:hypothetical protein